MLTLFYLICFSQIFGTQVSLKKLAGQKQKVFKYLSMIAFKGILICHSTDNKVLKLPKNQQIEINVMHLYLLIAL